MTTYWEGGQARVVVRVATHILGEPGPTCIAVNCCPVSNDDRRVVVVPVVGQADFNGGFDVFEIERDHPEMHNPTIAQGEPVLSGGVPALYDGAHCSELGTHYYPFIEDAEAGGIGSLTAETTYQWVAVYEWRDARGVRHQSVPSAIQELKLDVGEDSASFNVSTLQLTERQDVESSSWPVWIVIYRTLSNGSIFYRETGTPVIGANVENDLDDAWYTHYSTVADSSLATSEILYTDGGVLVNGQPPALRHVVQHAQRLWGISRDNPRQIWVSKILQPGYEMPGFPLQLVLQSDVDHVALASLGSNLLALSEDGVWAYAGEPPNDLGAGGTLSGPHAIARHTGCVSPLSVVQVPDGVAFQSRESFWLVGKGMQADRIGGPVEDTLQTYPYCRSAVLDQERELVLFTMADGENRYGDSPQYGVTLAWHYLLNEWTIWHYPDSATNGMEPGRSAAVCWRGNLARYEYHQVQDDGTVIYPSNGYHDHDGSDPQLSVISPWLQFAGVAGFQRVKRIHFRGTYLGAHSLSVKIWYDFEAAATDTLTFSEAEVAALIDGTEEHLRIHRLSRPKCKAIRVEVTATAGASPATGGLVRWETMAFEAGGKQGLFKLPDAGSK